MQHVVVLSPSTRTGTEKGLGTHEKMARDVAALSIPFASYDARKMTIKSTGTRGEAVLVISCAGPFRVFFTPEERAWRESRRGAEEGDNGIGL